MRADFFFYLFQPLGSLFIDFAPVGSYLKLQDDNTAIKHNFNVASFNGIMNFTAHVNIHTAHCEKKKSLQNTSFLTSHVILRYISRHFFYIIEQ